VALSQVDIAAEDREKRLLGLAGRLERWVRREG
jgi:hypothetical protein